MRGLVLFLCKFAAVCSSDVSFDQEVCLLQQNAFLQRHRLGNDELTGHTALPKYDEGLNWPFTGQASMSVTGVREERADFETSSDASAGSAGSAGTAGTNGNAGTGTG